MDRGQSRVPAAEVSYPEREGTVPPQGAFDSRALFGLKKLRIEYVPCHRGASKFTDNFIRVGGLYVGHWDTVAKQGGSAATLLVESKGVSVLQGHTHRFGAHARTTVDGRVLLGIENFCMCQRRAGYVS